MEVTGETKIHGTNSEAIFEQVFKAHFKDLHRYAFTILKDVAAAEETVQQVFLKLWEQKDELHIHSSLKAYLYKSVYNDSLNFIKHQKVRAVHKAHVLHTADEAIDNGNNRMLMKEIEEKLRKSLNDLPEQCRTIFQLSRFEHLKYKEIAEHLGLSVKTVENQMGKALKLLRNNMADYLPLILITLLTLLLA